LFVSLNRLIDCSFPVVLAELQWQLSLRRTVLTGLFEPHVTAVVVTAAMLNMLTVSVSSMAG
jgi:hypothetical protein